MLVQTAMQHGEPRYGGRVTLLHHWVSVLAFTNEIRQHEDSEIIEEYFKWMNTFFHLCRMTTWRYDWPTRVWWTSTKNSIKTKSHDVYRYRNKCVYLVLYIAQSCMRIAPTRSSRSFCTEISVVLLPVSLLTCRKWWQSDESSYYG